MSDHTYREWPTRRGLGALVDDGPRIAVWAVLQFCLHFAEQIAELVAPLLFVAGLGWWAALRVITAIPVEDPKIAEMMQKFPASLMLDGRQMTPHRLIVDGLLLMAVVAACRTASAIIAKET